MASQSLSRSRDLSDRAREAESLLNRYPKLSERELARLMDSFNRLPLLDFGIMAADDRLSDKLDAFYRDHGKEMLAPGGRMVWALGIIAALAIVLLYWAAA